MNLCDQKEIKTLLSRYGFHFSKSMGQNFLIEAWVPQEIAAVSGAAPGMGVLEIGPGIGPLTAELALRAERVVSVELDNSLLPVLAETMAEYPNVEIVPGDIMKTDIARLCAEKLPGLSLLASANLPYQITTPAITALLQANCFEAVTVMIQREVALRICAAPGSAEYGAFTLFCQYYADSEVLYDVPPSCFYPQPKVMSSVIRMNVRGKPPVKVTNEKLFFRVVRAAFAQRRKTLINALQPVLEKNFDKEKLREILTACNLTENIRGERLSFAEFAQLSEKIGEF